jgi:hypothetical protein
VRRHGEDGVGQNLEGHVVNESWMFGMGADASNSPKTAQEVAMEFTEEEKEEIRVMKGMSNLYDKVCYACFMTCALE